MTTGDLSGGALDDLEDASVGVEDSTFAALLSDIARAPTEPVEPFLAPGQRVGDYEIEAAVGRGAFGTVYRAVHPTLGVHVAIKVLSRARAADPGTAARFVDEARLLHRLRHPNIVTLHGFGELATGQSYYAMELLEGKTLAAVLASGGPLAPPDALAVLRQVAAALDAAHRESVLHRDLKPDNVFVVGEPGPTCTVKLLDFGIAKILGDNSADRTRTGMLIGTPAYMSPEQCGGEPVGTSSDVYSLGVIAHELFTGARLFRGSNARETMALHMFEKPPAASSILHGLPAELDRALLAMLEKRAHLRPANATSAVDALELALAAKGSRWRSARRRWPVAAALALLVSLWPAYRLLGARAHAPESARAYVTMASHGAPPPARPRGNEQAVPTPAPPARVSTTAPAPQSGAGKAVRAPARVARSRRDLEY